MWQYFGSVLDVCFEFFHEIVLAINKHNHVGESKLKSASNTVLHFVLGHNQVLISILLVLVTVRVWTLIELWLFVVLLGGRLVSDLWLQISAEFRRLFFFHNLLFGLDVLCLLCLDESILKTVVRIVRGIVIHCLFIACWNYFFLFEKSVWIRIMSWIFEFLSFIGYCFLDTLMFSFFA